MNKPSKKPAPKKRRVIKRPAAGPGGIDLLKIAGKVRVPDAGPGQDQDNAAATLLGRTLPAAIGDGGRTEEKMVLFIMPRPGQSIEEAAEEAAKEQKKQKARNEKS